jgi:dTDP-4-dehydrorhamnose 3,5-epimerase
MKISQTSLKGVFIIEPDVFGDEHGFFLETYNQKRYHDFDIPSTFLQDNLSFSVKHTLRGLHYQIKNPQAKLVQVIVGEIFDVVVDLRPDSATFGKWEGVHLTDRNKQQVYIPEGFAHGFCVLSERALFMYKCSNFYNPDDEGGILWSDPNLQIDWPVKDPIISEKDKKFPRLSEIHPQFLPDVKINYHKASI